MGPRCCGPPRYVGHEPGIACILGTGSNSCLYDGKKITARWPTWVGSLLMKRPAPPSARNFLFDHLRNKMPATLSEQFQKRFPFTREEFLEKIYQGEKAKYLPCDVFQIHFQHLKEPYCYGLVYG